MAYNTPLTGRAAEFPNLRPLDSDTARAAQRKSVESRMLNRELRATFKRNAQAFADVLDDIPQLDALGVLRLAIHMALQENDYTEAARLSKDLAEYTTAKVNRKDAPKEVGVADLSDEELEAIIAKEYSKK